MERDLDFFLRFLVLEGDFDRLLFAFFPLLLLSLLLLLTFSLFLSFKIFSSFSFIISEDFGAVSES